MVMKVVMVSHHGYDHVLNFVNVMTALKTQKKLKKEEK